MMTQTEKINVFCVDDNTHVLEALRIQLNRMHDMQWAGCAEHADGLLAQAERNCPSVVLLDIDMPGKDAFEATHELMKLCPCAKVLFYSGLIRRDLVNRAIDSGAWGYVAKTDGESALMSAIRAVAAGQMGFSNSIHTILSEQS